MNWLKRIFSRKNKALRINILHESAKLPTKSYDAALGYDLYLSSPDDWENGFSLAPRETRIFPTDISVEFPTGYGGIIKDRSGVAAKKNCHVLAGVIDEDYRGKIGIVITNLSDKTRVFQPGDRIAQMILVPTVSFPVVEAINLSDTKRGKGGFASSGD